MAKNGVCDDGRSKGNEVKRSVLCDLGTVSVLSQLMPQAILPQLPPLRRIALTVALGMHLVQSRGQKESSLVASSSLTRDPLLSWKV